MFIIIYYSFFSLLLFQVVLLLIKTFLFLLQSDIILCHLYYDSDYVYAWACFIMTLSSCVFRQ